MATVFDVHQYLKDKLRVSGAVKLHKLLFAINRLSIARTGDPMFLSEAEAWKWGPVFAEVYFNQEQRGDVRVISDADAAIISEVCRTLGSKAGSQLASRSHDRYPEWQEMRAGLGPNEPSRKVITFDAMRRALAQELVAIVDGKVRIRVPSKTYGDIDSALTTLHHITNGRPLF